MTIEEHLRTMLGDLMLTIARVSAENDALKAQLADLPQRLAQKAPKAK